MSAPSIVQQASENLLETYFALGIASESTKVTQERGYRLCLSEIDHPICNFAADLDLDANAAGSLAVLAAHHPSFHVYCLPGDRPKNADGLLRTAGFNMTHGLTQMLWSPADSGVRAFPGSSMTEAVTAFERESIATFMAEQFFATQRSAFRRRVAEATTRAEHLRLLSLNDKRRVVGAVMLCESNGSLGVYNLCVAASCRGRGWGHEIVRSVKALAAGLQKPLVLQCDQPLEGWYEGLGFNPVGMVEVFSLAVDARAAIMS